MSEADTSGPDPSPERGFIKEALGLYGVVFVLILGLALFGQVQSVVGANLYLIVALVFMGVPMLWMQRKKLDPESFGMTTKHMLRQLGVGLVAGAITFVPFVIGQYVWETQVLEQRFEFDVENWSKWSLELEGEPQHWGDEPGAWVWTEEEALHIGMRSEEQRRLAVMLEADEAFVPEVKGPGVVWRAVDAKGRKRTSRTPSTKWEVLPVLYGRPVEVTLKEGPGAHLPREVTLSTIRADGYEDDPLPLFKGPGAEPQDAREANLERDALWILMWWITQLFFIALPEEYFYRGYVQTRLGQGFRARGTKREVFWWLTPENLLTSFLFGIGHLFIPVNGVILPGRFSVFFPSLLFGALRERTGSITSSVMYHACCNMMVLIWSVHYT